MRKEITTWLSKSAQIIFLLCIVLFLKAQTAPEMNATAAEKYKQKDYQGALDLYQQMLSKHVEAADVYYNLGNCYYKTGDIGRSILNYERAHKLAPDDEDILHNLQLAQTQTVDKPIPVPELAISKAWKSFTGSFTSSGWGLYSVILIWVALLLFAVHLFLTKNKLLTTTAVVLLMVSFVFLMLALEQSSEEENPDAAILLVKNVSVKSAPDENSTDLFSIHEGVKLKLLDHVGSWYKVRLIDGKVGWVESTTFEKI